MPDRKSPVLFLSALAADPRRCTRSREEMRGRGGGGEERKRPRKLPAANYQEKTYWTSPHNRAKYLVMEVRHSERRDSVITKPYQSSRHGLVIGCVSPAGSLLFHISYGLGQTDSDDLSRSRQ